MANKIVEMKPVRSINTKGGSRSILPVKNALTYQNCGDLETAYQECVAGNKTEIILDCQALTFIDSESLELLLRMHEELKARGGALKFIDLNDICRDILIATRLMNVLNIYKDIHGAIKTWQ